MGKKDIKAMKVFGRRDLSEDDVAVEGASRVAPRVANDPVPPGAAGPPGLMAALRERVLKQIDIAAATGLTPAVLQREIEQIVHEIANEDRVGLSAREQTRLAEALVSDMTGYGPLDALLRDNSITDIMVNSPTSIFIERNGKLQLSDVHFRDADHITAVAQKIAAQIGRRIDESSPMVDARLSDGSRVNVILPPLAIDSPCISIRKFSRQRLDLTAMVGNGTMSAGIARLLGIAARARLNILISGGTGSGKTTLLNALSHLIDHGERIISIEDAAELQLQQPHVIRLETRPPNLEGSGQITQNDLLRNALRMRPDRIIVGEVRGTEAFDMLQAMNTGHDGSISTVHANTTRDALTRVENMVLMGHVNLPLRAIRSQIVGALDLIIHVERMRDGVRRVTQITEVCGLEAEVITTNDLAVFEFEREGIQGQIVGQYRPPGVRPAFFDRLEYYGLDRAWLAAEREV
jgi:pilus assembly protein CpaF